MKYYEVHIKILSPPRKASSSSSRKAAVESVLYAKPALSGGYAIAVGEEANNAIAVSFSAPSKATPVPSDVCSAVATFSDTDQCVRLHSD